jgi:hypothetical protein
VSYARRKQQAFLAQCIWWLASIIGLERGLINHIDNLNSRIESTVIPGEEIRVSLEEKAPDEAAASSPQDSPEPTVSREKQENYRKNKILKECEEYLKDSRRLRDLATSKANGKTKTGRINPSAVIKLALKVTKKIKRESYNKTEGISDTEIARRKSSGECLRCAWPADRKGTHRVKDCNHPIKLDKGTVDYPQKKGYTNRDPQELGSSNRDDTESD